MAPAGAHYRHVNGELIVLYWRIGRDILVRQARDGWGAKVVERLAADLRAECHDARGFSPANLRYMRAFAGAWPDPEILQRVVGRLPWGQNTEEVAEIYRALSRLFPRPPESDLDEGLVSTFDSIGHLRDGIPRYLAHRGTVPATLALRRLVADLGDQPWLAYELGVAEQAMRVTTWSPISVCEILALTDKPDMTMVTSAAHLGDVLLAALARWQAELHGAQNPVRAL